VSGLGTVEPERVIADLRELEKLTGGAGGARRLAWTAEWLQAREWLRSKLGELPCRVHRDPAGNLVADLPGQAAGFFVVGSHLDSVPAGGWLDGALGVIAGLELVRASADGPPPPIGLRLIDWADEEGARFGRSLFGSSAAAGALESSQQAQLTDADGVTLADAMRDCGLEIMNADGARRSLDGVVGYLELHIEQGPVLEQAGRQVAVVTGTVGVERRLLRLVGEAAHAGAAPMDMRRDPLVTAARAITAIVDAARSCGATATFGSIELRPGVVTVVPERCELAVDLRHPDPLVLARLVAEADAAVAGLGAASDVSAAWEPQWKIEPIAFDPELVELARAGCEDMHVEPVVMPSGALHDAAAVARVVPAVMLLTPSRHGISHSPAEDTDEADLAVGIRAFEAVAHRALEWGAARR
jgi:hydantoinase/carbamoylase family amidase